MLGLIASNWSHYAGGEWDYGRQARILTGEQTETTAERYWQLRTAGRTAGKCRLTVGICREL